jgi:xanthine dehydrogenase accessory factor
MSESIQHSWHNMMAQLLLSRSTFATITIIDEGGSAPREIGAKMLVLPNGEFYGSVGGGELERQLLAQTKEILTQPIAHAKKILIPLSAKTGQCCGGVVEAFIEVITGGIPFYIFGAGHVGEQIALILHSTPFCPILIDERSDWPRPEFIPSNTRVLRSHSIAVEELKTHKMFYAAVLTHSHDLDYSIIKNLLNLDFAYLGLIGSKTKRTRFEQRLLQDGISASQLEQLDCPMGIDLGGGKSPREVAISLAAKILTIHHHHHDRNK